MIDWGLTWQVLTEPFPLTCLILLALGMSATWWMER